MFEYGTSWKEEYVFVCELHALESEHSGECHQLPAVELIIAQLKDAKKFSKLDGFWQISLAPLLFLPLGEINYTDYPLG